MTSNILAACLHPSSLNSNLSPIPCDPDATGCGGAPAPSPPTADPARAIRLAPQAFGSGGNHQWGKVVIPVRSITLQCQGLMGFLQTTPHLALL